MPLDTIRTVVPSANDISDYDAKLREAGLTGLWQPRPGDISPELVKLGEELVDLSQKAGRINKSDVELIRDLGESIVGVVSGLFISGRPNKADQPAFRAHTAIDKGKGNCMASHEAVYGILNELQLADNTLAIWDGSHVETGLVTGRTTSYLDSFYEESGPNRGTLLQGEYRAWLSTARSKTPKLVTVLNASETDVVDIELDQFHEIALKPYTGQRLIMPGAAAVLMFCAMASQSPDNQTHPQATDVLKPYALGF